jgi:hypothetical protein
MKWKNKFIDLHGAFDILISFWWDQKQLSFIYHFISISIRLTYITILCYNYMILWHFSQKETCITWKLLRLRMRMQNSAEYEKILAPRKVFLNYWNKYVFMLNNYSRVVNFHNHNRIVYMIFLSKRYQSPFSMNLR